LIRHVAGAGLLAWYTIALVAHSLADAQELAGASSAGELQAVVVQATAIAGAAIEADKLPGSVQTLSAADLARAGPASLTGAMDSRLSSVNINDNLDDPFQPDILYRGFEASPVLGTPQGLAVYQNGVRINEAFGDAVNWDLFPAMAISRVVLVSSSPVYGLNALGGGISVSMKDGFSYHGSELELSGGSFGNHALALQYGANAGAFGLYVAGNALQNTGWRPDSEDSLRQLYTALSQRSGPLSLDLSYTRGDDQLQGQGAAPVQEQAVDRSLVFTGPQSNINRLNFTTLRASWAASEVWSLQSVLYDRQYQQLVDNGNTTSYTACTTAADAGLLCQADGLTPVSGPNGQALPDISQGGTRYIGEDDFETINAYGRGAAMQSTDKQPILGHGNVLTVGAVLDYAQLNFRAGTRLGRINSQLLVEPSDLIVDTPESSPFGADPVILKGINRVYGLYLTDTLDVTPAVSVTGSARYNDATIALDDLRGSTLSGENRFAHVNPALGITWKLLSTVTAYAGVAQNARTPTASEIECSNPLAPCLLPSNLAGDPPTLKQVIAHTLEFGLRGRYAVGNSRGGAVSWNLGAFHTDLDDDIYGIATSISSGFYQNIGATRRQGIEAGFSYDGPGWSGYLNYSFVDARFESPLRLPSPSNPFQDASGDIQVEPGDRLPGIPQHRLKAGLDYRGFPNWTIGASVKFVSSQFYFGDESNQLPPMPSYQVLGLHASYQLSRRLELDAHVDNLLNAKYSTYGILSDPTGVGAPGIPLTAVSNGPGVDNRFTSPAYPLSIYAGFRITL
jgi:iron complex outermembrane receptor protein